MQELSIAGIDDFLAPASYPVRYRIYRFTGMDVYFGLLLQVQLFAI